MQRYLQGSPISEVREMETCHLVNFCERLHAVHNNISLKKVAPQLFCTSQILWRISGTYFHAVFWEKNGHIIGWHNAGVGVISPLRSPGFATHFKRQMLFCQKLRRHDIWIRPILSFFVEREKTSLSFSGRRILEIRRMVCSSKIGWCKSHGHKTLHRNPGKVKI